MSRLRATTAAALSIVRRSPPVHWAAHQVALQLVKTRWGERFVRGVVGPQVHKDYRAWIQAFDTLTDEDRDAIRRHIDRFRRRPLISVVMAAYRSDPYLLHEAVSSVRAQLYPHWELCIADDASPGAATWAALTELAAGDERIKLVRRGVNGGIAAATNSALELATGEFVALMDHDDLLAERALYEVAAELDRHPDADLIYSDEDKLDHKGRRYEPYFKTGWNPELLLAQNMISHLGVYRRSLLETLGGLRQGFEGSQDYDLALRASERTNAARIHHIPWVLYHWRQDGGPSTFSQAYMDRCADSARRAVEEHLARTGQVGARVANQANAPGWIEVRRDLPQPRPLVSIIVPTRDRADLLAQCAEGVLARTAYPALELLVVDNGSVEAETKALFDRLRQDARVRVLDAPGPFNFSALNNLAAGEAKGEVLVLLNNDISMTRDDWLDVLVAQAMRPNVGAVGARLLFPDGRVQHAGVVLGINGVAGHLLYRAAGKDPGYYRHLTTPRNVSAVTGACLAIRKAVYDEVGGLDAEHLPVAFNDVDLCLKVRAAGYDIVWTPHAELVHHESATRGDDRAPGAQARFAADAAVMRARWGEALTCDPFYNAVFDRTHSDYRLGDPPPRAPPWMRLP